MIRLCVSVPLREQNEIEELTTKNTKSTKDELLMNCNITKLKDGIKRFVF